MQLGPHFVLLVLVKLFEIRFHEGRLHRTRTDAVDAHAAGVIHGKLPGERHHRALGGAIREAALDADEPGHGADVDDGSPRFQQLGHRRPGHQKHALHVDAQQLLKVRPAGFLDPAHQADAGVIDQDIERLDRADACVNRLLVGNVEDQHLRAAELGGEGSGAVAIDIGDGHQRARLRQRAAGGLADAAGPACHQGFAPVQSKRCLHHTEL